MWLLHDAACVPLSWQGQLNSVPSVRVRTPSLRVHIHCSVPTRRIRRTGSFRLRILLLMQCLWAYSITYLQIVYVTKKVSELKTIVFSALNLQDQVNITNVVRPTPAVSITQVQAHYKNTGSFTRRFHISLGLYDKVSWLCGFEKTNTLLFSCLLFGGSRFLG